MPEPDVTPGRREALIVAADSYADPKLRALRAPARDAAELARVLGDPEVGDFQVDVSLNEPDHVVRRRLSEFFRDRDRDDLLLLHVSGHGLKDEDGTLYFASSNTAVEHLEATAIPSEFVNRQMTKSRSRRIVLLLDCCFGGAFARGMVHRAGESLAIREEFEGQGRVVLTASRAMEYAFEGESREGDAQPSIFTSAIVKGLASGEADTDGDSRISIDELYDYVYDRVREATPNQTPSKWTFDVQGDLYVARSPFSQPEPVPLPVELTAALESPFANVRAGAVAELAGLLASADARLAAAARVALEALGQDDSKRVSEAAAGALAGEVGGFESAAAAITPPAIAARPGPRRTRSSSTASQLAVRLARAARWKDGLAFAGAALLVLGYFRRASWDSSWYFAVNFQEGIWALWSPLEAFGAALLVAGAVGASRRGRLRREPVDGLLLGVGVVLLAAAIAFVGSSFEVGGAAFLTGLGALAVLSAGALGLLTRQAPEAPLPRRSLTIAGVGAALGLSPLVVNVEPWESALLEGWGRPFYLEVLVAGAAAAVAVGALVRNPRTRLQAAGAVVGIGVLLALHLISRLVFVGTDERVQDIRLGAPLGIAGGLLLVVAGAKILRGERPAEAPTSVSTATS
jgi:hypothetical protein